MRISDWSSDVCSSDLLTNPATLPHEYCNPTLPITPSLSTALAGAQDKLRPRAEVEGAALQISQPRHLTQMATRPCETRRNPAISALSDPLAARFQVRRRALIGRGARRERGGQYGLILACAVSIKKKKPTLKI